MTTIAANLKCMASDSRATLSEGLSYPTDKIKKVKKMLVGVCGHGGDCSRFLDWAARDFKEPAPKWHCKPDSDDSIVALVLKSDGVYVFVQTDPEPERVNAPYYAIGTGGQPARIAMKLGKTPAEAVDLAMEVDDLSGPPVQVLEL
jgi:hypothetical protein